MGLLDHTQYWQWNACGKHPMVLDYFSIGKSDPIMKAFSDWVGKGYQNTALKKTPANSLCSWRFWAKVPRKDTLVCGLLKDSSDHAGRPYPLLIMGAGPLKVWERHWDLLPFACERAWSQIENLSTKIFQDLKTFELEVFKMKSPQGQWSEFEAERKYLWESGPISFESDQTHPLKRLEEIASRESERHVIMVRLNNDGFYDQFTLISLWHYYLKKHISVIPNVLFMGGTPEKASMIVLKRPLQPDDFSRLWFSSSEELKENGSVVTW